MPANSLELRSYPPVALKWRGILSKLSAPSWWHPAPKAWIVLPHGFKKGFPERTSQLQPKGLVLYTIALLFQVSLCPACFLPSLPELLPRVLSHQPLDTGVHPAKLNKTEVPSRTKRRAAPEAWSLKTFLGATRLFYIPTSEFVGGSTWLSSFALKSVSVSRISLRRDREEEWPLWVYLT